MVKYVRNWINLISQIEKEVNLITPINLCERLLEWAIDFRKDKNYQDLYKFYIEYFNNIDLELYNFEERWYSFPIILKQLIDIKDADATMKLIVPRVGYVLHEILIYKSNRPCKYLEEDDLRVFFSSDTEKFFFSCDGCGYSENIEGEAEEILSVCLPATAEQIKMLNIMPSF